MIRWKRIELHNHTIESDGNFTVEELAAFFKQQGVDAFSLTDHNTISGHRKLRNVQEADPVLSCLYGMEFTTYYGHILCQNMPSYFSWHDIDPQNPDHIFLKARACGAVVGIAHPFSAGRPLENGCRFDMTVQDFSHVDFIEVVNNGEDFLHINSRAIAWWESLVLRGHRLAAITGLDLHGERSLDGCYTTYFACDDSLPFAESFAKAVKSQQTLVTRGPVFTVERTKNALHAHLLSTTCSQVLTVTVTTPGGTTVYPFPYPDGSLELPVTQFPAVVKLYEREAELINLLAIAPPIFG